MTLSAAERAAISRQNGQKSKGPTSPEGKQRSRFNALKHGLKAKRPVLPGEDAQQYQGRLDAWMGDLQPRNDVEQSLVQRAVTLTWQLDRAERAEAARLSSIIRAAPEDAARRQEEEAAALGQRLFHDPCGPLPLYPHALYYGHGQPRVSSSGLGDDPDAPPRLLLRLEAKAAGCRWLLDRWAELGALLDRGLSWQSPDKLRAIRLLGRQPLDAADSELVATIFQACHVLAPQAHHQCGVAPGEAAILEEAIRTSKTMGPGAFAGLRDQPGGHDAVEPEPDQDSDESDDGDPNEEQDAEDRIAWQSCGAAFSELLGELTQEEAREYRRRLEGRQVDQLRPQDPAAARATLRAIVEKAVIRLAAKLEVHQARAALEAAEAVDRLSFDESVEGERLRRFQLAGQRALLRTVDSLRKLRRDEPPQPTEGDPAEPAGTVATVAGLTETIGCGADGTDSSLGSDLLPAIPDPPLALEPEPAAENPPNEPTAAGVDRPSAPANSPAARSEPRIAPNEPGHAPPVTGHEQLASSASPPPASASAIGSGADLGTDAAAPLSRGIDRDDCLAPGRQGQTQALAGTTRRFERETACSPATNRLKIREDVASGEVRGLGPAPGGPEGAGRAAGHSPSRRSSLS